MSPTSCKKSSQVGRRHRKHYDAKLPLPFIRGNDVDDMTMVRLPNYLRFGSYFLDLIFTFLTRKM